MRRVDYEALPYTVVRSIYDADGYHLPADFDTWNDRLYGYVVDWDNRLVHEVIINDGFWFVLVWHDWHRDANGNPHPVAAYEILPIDIVGQQQ